MRRLEKLLWVAGLAALDVWLGANADKAVYQAWQGWVFDQELSGKPATIAAFIHQKQDQVEQWLGLEQKPQTASLPRPSMEQPPAPKPEAPKPEARPEALPGNAVIGRLTIPRLHLSAIVREGDDEDTLRVALGHIPSTALPWQEGNVGVAGHRDTLFRALRRIRKNDVIVFETLSGRYVYRVQGTEIVNPRDVSVLNAQASPELTLVTCYPFYFVGAAPERFIVKALQVTGRASEVSVNAPAGLGASGVGGM